MLCYFTTLLNTHTLKIHPRLFNIPVVKSTGIMNWTSQLSEDINQAGMLGEHLTHTKQLKFLVRFTMTGYYLFFFCLVFSPKPPFVERFRNLEICLDNEMKRFRSFTCKSSNPHQTHLSGIHIRQQISIKNRCYPDWPIHVTQNYLTFYDHK